LQFGEDLELFFRTIIGTGANPNVAACVVIGIEEGWTKRVVDHRQDRQASDRLRDRVERRHRHHRESGARRQGLSAMGVRTRTRRMRHVGTVVSTKCGESDTTTGLASCPTIGNLCDKLIPPGIYGCFGETSEITGAEHLAVARAASPEIGEKWMKTWQAYENEVIQAHETNDLSESEPTKGNIAGGLTMIEEKALGNLEKVGRTCRYIDVLEPTEASAKGPGLYYMDTSSAAAECVTLMAAAGYVVHTFPTGQGNIIGNPIVPVIKITGNPRTARTTSEHIDLDVSGILRRDMTLDQAGDALIKMVRRAANGRLAAAEALGHREFVLTKLYCSA
jgi:(2R)-sulfolactate sulfo-lyase subunit beta